MSNDFTSSGSGPELGSGSGRGGRPGPPPSRRGFLIELDGSGPFGAADVRGFSEALFAAENPEAPMPRRLILSRPDPALAHYLAAWSEDVVHVRRRITIGCREGKVGAVVTLSSFGAKVDPSLAIESLTPVCDEIDALFLESGIHPKALVDAALARQRAARAAPSSHGLLDSLVAFPPEF